MKKCTEKIDKKWDIKLEDIEDPCVRDMMDDKWRRAKEVMDQRTAGFSLFSLISHNQSIYNGQKDNTWSEGSTQGMKRKVRAQTIQRIPDGEVTTQFDKNSIEQVEIEFLFKNKILYSEYQGEDMLKNLWKTFGESYDYGFACVRTGFEKDIDGDFRCSYTIIPWNDVLPEPDCDSIEEADWVIVREYMSRSALEDLLDDDGNCTDSTYNEDVVRYLVENKMKDGMDPNSMALADRKKGVSKIESVEIRTLYERGSDEFVTYVHSIGAVLRRVKNYDPRKDIPIHFLVLDPDPEFPLGCSQIMWTIGQQQFADAFLTLSYQTLLLAHQPPLMGFGNLTPAKIKMKPRAFWPMGTNPNNKIEKFPVETTTLTQYGSILENVQARMMASLNIADGTIASDAGQSAYSKTAPGVEQQQRDKTVTVNQYQKRIEVFFSEWANHALRSYIASMSGKHYLTVDERTRRRVWDIEMSMADPEVDGGEMKESIINGDQIEIDFDALSTDMLAFHVKTGSLIESEKDMERKFIQDALVPISQMMGSVSDQNKASFEKVLMKLVVRLLEMSDIDVSQETADIVDDQLMLSAMKATMEQVASQQGQIDQLAQGMQGMQAQQAMGAPGGEMPMSQEPVPQEPMPQAEATPMPQGAAPTGDVPPMPEAGGQAIPEVPSAAMDIPGGQGEGNPNMAMLEA